jgi:hypothetical protein
VQVGGGGGGKLFRVSYSTIALPSKVFRKMLFGGFAEGRTAVDAVMLSDDNAEVTEIFLTHMHNRFGPLPDAVDVEK